MLKQEDQGLVSGWIVDQDLVSGWGGDHNPGWGWTSIKCLQGEFIILSKIT